VRGRARGVVLPGGHAREDRLGLVVARVEARGLQGERPGPREVAGLEGVGGFEELAPDLDVARVAARGEQRVRRDRPRLHVLELEVVAREHGVEREGEIRAERVRRRGDPEDARRRVDHDRVRRDQRVDRAAVSETDVRSAGAAAVTKHGCGRRRAEPSPERLQDGREAREALLGRRVAAAPSVRAIARELRAEEVVRREDEAVLRLADPAAPGRPLDDDGAPLASRKVGDGEILLLEGDRRIDEQHNDFRKPHGAQRVGVFLGTSTAGILQTELAYRRRDPDSGALPPDFIYRTTHNTFSVADFVRHYFDLRGPAVVVSSACSSSAKVFGSARRMLEAGWIDAALVGGVDSLCLTTLYGFNSLGLTSETACRPFDMQRNGISIGEAAAFALLERTPDHLDAGAVLLLGTGESSDAYHMSSPHPEGLGAQRAMREALETAGLSAADIDYINLHGTATPSNDAAEGKAVAAVFGPATPCSSTKGATGHTLGAAGGLEAVICALALQHDFVPGGMNIAELDPAVTLDYAINNRPQTLGRVLSNSFGFGGTNCSLIFARADRL